MSLALTSGQLKSVALASTAHVFVALVMKTKSLALDSETCPYWVNSRPTLIFDSLLLLCNINFACKNYYGHLFTPKTLQLHTRCSNRPRHSKALRGEEWGTGSLPSQLGGMVSVISFPDGVGGEAPAENDFSAFSA